MIMTLTRGRNEFTIGARFAAAPANEYKEQNSNGRFDYDSSLNDFTRE